MEVLEFERVKNDLQRKIATSVLQAGTRLLSERDMAVEYGVSRITIRRALHELENLGDICKVPGKGTFVSSKNTTLNRLISAFCFYDLYTDEFYAEVFSGILQEAHKLGFHLTVGKLELDLHSKNMVDRLSSQHSTDGYLLIGSIPDELLQMFQQQNKPIVLVDNVSEERQIPSIMGDNLGGAHAVVEHLVKLGHKRIAHMVLAHNEPLPTPFAMRREGWKTALEDAGITQHEELLMCWDFEADPEGKTIRDKILTIKPTAIFCSNDMTAVYTMRLMESMGLAVPKDVSIVGFDDTHLARVMSLTTVTVPKKEMGTIAVKRLINQFNDTDFGPLTTMLPVRLATRRSTAKPRTDK